MKAGRNDPCPCGSGKKYKKCCLGKDESRAAGAPDLPRRQASPPEAPSAAPAGPTFVPPAQPETTDAPPTPQRRLSEFRKRDHPGRRALFEQSVRDGAIDAATAREMLSLLRKECLRRNERDRFDELLASLRRHRGDVYEAHELDYVRWAVADAVAIPRYDLLAVRAREMAAMAGRHFDAFHQMADLLAYHDRLDILLKGLRVAWRQVRDAASPQAEELTRQVRDAELFDYLQHARRPHAKDRDLLARLSAYGPASPDDLAGRIAHLTGQARVQPAPADPGHPQFPLLLDDFTGHLRRDAHLSWCRADLGTQAVAACLAGSDALLPGRAALDAYITRLLAPPAPLHYRAAAAMETLPAWVRFLASAKLAAEPETALTELTPVHARVRRSLSADLDDPAPLRALGQGWEHT
ncbi:MAG: SEC-C metal-binding domain-containing protein [Planctomycetota bacterium]|jgi:hypothetical protein